MRDFMDNDTVSTNQKHQLAYQQKILSLFEQMMKRSRKIKRTGKPQFQGHQGTDFSISGVIETQEKILVIESCADRCLSLEDIEVIVQGQFDPLSKEEEIIAIIDSKNGFEKQVLTSFPSVHYPLVLTSQTQLITTNILAPPITKGFKIIDELFQISRTSKPIFLSSELKYELVAFITDGTTRLRLYFALLSRPKYIYELARELKTSPASVYRAIHALKSKKLLICLNPKSSRRKYYQLTPLALALREDLMAFNNRNQLDTDKAD